MFRKCLMIAAFLGAGCVTSGPAKPRPPDEYRLADGTLVVCRMEAETGSNYRQRVCRRVEGSAPSAANQQEINRVMNAPEVNTRVGN